MAPNSKDYDPIPPIPTYDEAVASSSRANNVSPSTPSQNRPHSPVDDPHAPESSESFSLLRNPRNASEASSSQSSHQAQRGRYPRGYRPPTVETDDESGLFSSSDDSDSDADEREADQVRREMQELEIDDSDVHGRSSRGASLWGKRIGRLSLALPQWRWKWRWRLPVPRLRIRLGRDSDSSGDDAGGRGGSAGTDGSGATDSTQTTRWRFALPKLGSTALFLLVARVLALIVVLGFLYLLFASNVFSDMARRMARQIDPETLRIHIQASVDPRVIRDNLKHFTSYAHLSGTEGDFALMEDIELMFQSYGLDEVKRDVYHVYLNYPKADGRAVQVLGPDGKPTWSAKLEEEETHSETAGHQTYAFHGHSKSGTVKGPLIYANYGTREDFEMLKKKGIDTKGAIALVRSRGSQDDPALQVKAAELAGFSGCLIFSNPGDHGRFQPQSGAPNGPHLPADGVERASVSLRNWVVGDVLTPGWGSKERMPRMKVDQTKGLVKIPSLPLAWRDAEPLLKRLKGFGDPIPDTWSSSAFDYKDMWTGNASSPIVLLKNEQDEIEKQPIWNVYGRIEGIEQEEKRVIIGNHRDAWGFGAASPHSGTAIMLEIARIMGDLVARGWRPQRTIEFMSWDGGAQNLIGSTEYVEQNDESLRKDAFAYINLDKAVSGDTFRAAGSPVFHRLLLQILNRVGDPFYNTTLRDRWEQRQGRIEGLGTDSDYVAFQDIVGTSSLDLHFDGKGYPRHSNWDNFDWMEQHGDPGFVYHALLAQVLGLLVLELSDRLVLPFDMISYASSLSTWTDKLELWADEQGAKKAAIGPEKKPFSLAALKDAVKEVDKSVHEFIKFEVAWENSVMASNGWEPSSTGRQRCEYNSRMAKFESDLLDLDGVSISLI